MLNIKLLGVFRIEKINNRMWLELGPAGRGLASYFFTYPDRPHRRERLASLFWPDLDAEHARSALNSAIWRLRKILSTEPECAGGRSLQTVGSETILEREAWLDIDVVTLQEVAAVAATKDAVPLKDRRKLDYVADVLNRYEGPFLDGDDGDWILEERERLHSLFVRTAIRMVCCLARIEDYDRAIGLARHALNFDPFREELVRDFIAMLALDERRAEVLRYYEDWSKSLRRELNIAPLPATCALIEEIRAIQDRGGLERAANPVLAVISCQVAISGPLLARSIPQIVSPARSFRPNCEPACNFVPVMECTPAGGQVRV